MAVADKIKTGALWQRDCAVVINALEATVNAIVSDAAYGAGWNGDADNAPSKNAVYDQLQTMLGLIPSFGTGTYTPTLTVVSNLDSAGSGSGIYINLNGTVVVAVTFNVNPTATGLASVGISLPDASNIGATTDVCGLAASPVVTQCGGIYGDATNNRAELLFNATDTAERSIFAVFLYRVI